MSYDIDERYITLDNQITVFVRYREKAGGPTLLLVHGLGESSLCFSEAFEQESLTSYTLIAPDLPGFGRSSDMTPGLTSEAVLDWYGDVVLEVLAKLDREERVILVGHSMGGDLVTHLAKRYQDKFAGLCNLEGTLVEEDLFYSSEAVAALGYFDAWFDGFKSTMYQEGNSSPAYARYHASLCFCRPKAFLLCSEAVVDLCHDKPTGQRLSELDLPRLFVAGRRSGAAKGRLLLRRLGRGEKQNHDSLTVTVLDAGHWVMIEKPKEVYQLIADLIDGKKKKEQQQ